MQIFFSVDCQISCLMETDFLPATLRKTHTHTHTHTHTVYLFVNSFHVFYIAKIQPIHLCQIEMQRQTLLLNSFYCFAKQRRPQKVMS